MKEVIAKCVDCGKKKTILANDVSDKEMPLCDCGGIMLAESAKKY